MSRLVSGIQPTGNITLGNYLGAIKNFVKLQDELPEHEFFIFIADLHAITIHQDREKLRKNIKSLAALYLACGLRRERVHLFIQSEVYMHSQLGYIMECNGMLGELERMTQFKDKKAVYYTLGCKLNFAETSSIERMMQEIGIRTAKRGEVADVCVINSCAVTQEAEKKCRQEVILNVLELLK